MLGSFPPPRARWSMDFYYPNAQNDMWRIMGMLFYGDTGHFITGRGFDAGLIRDFCAGKGIALSDTAYAVRRLAGNASDDMLEVAAPADIKGMLRSLPQCRTVAVTGQKAMDTLLGIFEIDARGPAVGKSYGFFFEGRAIDLWRMPSTSRAYPRPIAQKAETYGIMLRACGILQERRPV